MKKILVLKGLPASGKSTYAKDLVNLGSWKRVNKDDLRLMLDNSLWSSKNEKMVIQLRNYIVKRSLEEGYNVIVDDTNFNPAHEQKMREIANEVGSVSVEVKFFDTPLDECIRRDLSRPNSVGEKVIRDMYKKYLSKSEEIKPYPVDKQLSWCVICDIDGTLALKGDRSPYDWSKVGLDSVNMPVQYVLNLINSNNALNDEGYTVERATIILLSGRDSVCRKDTEKWLKDNNIPYDYLFMRAEGDKRKDSIVKKEIFDKEIVGKYNVKLVLDDRNQVVQMWRSLGLTVFQVAEGDF